MSSGERRSSLESVLTTCYSVALHSGMQRVPPRKYAYDTHARS